MLSGRVASAAQEGLEWQEGGIQQISKWKDYWEVMNSKFQRKNRQEEIN